MKSLLKVRMVVMKIVLVERLSEHETSRLRELTALSATLEHEVVARITQNRKPDPTYYIGKGKAQELARVVKSQGAERVIFANPLKPSQAFKLEELTGVEVIDRFQLILEIFAMRAGSPEAKLQVEYAKLNYELPRVRERVERMRLEEFPGLRGGGEYEEEVRVDAIKRRMNSLKRKLESLEKSRQERRKRRRERGFKLIALAGYTNAGKSTLLNALSSAEVPVDNMLFTTLSPRTRVMRGVSKKALVTDTVGFIDDLPPWLIEAFKAALEEVFLADLVLLIVDVSEPLQEILRKVRASREILEDCPAEVVLVPNKIDLISRKKLEERVGALKAIIPNVVSISAEEGTNLDELLETVRSRLIKRLRVRLTTHQSSGVEKLLHELHEKAMVQEVEFENPTKVTFWTDERTLGELRKTVSEKAELKVIGEANA